MTARSTRGGRRALGRAAIGILAGACVAFPALFSALAAWAQEDPVHVSYPTSDGGTIHADRYGAGSHAVLLAHGAVFNKESWQPLARRLTAAGFQVLAIDFRGYGDSTAGSNGNALPLDVLGGIRYLHEQPDVAAVSVIGGSMGGGAAAWAATRASPGDIEGLVLLSAGSVEFPERMRAARILFIASEGEGMAPGIRAQYARAPDPKELVLLPGDAHAQHIFRTDQAERLTEEILRFLEQLRRPLVL